MTLLQVRQRIPTLDFDSGDRMAKQYAAYRNTKNFAVACRALVGVHVGRDWDAWSNDVLHGIQGVFAALEAISYVDPRDHLHYPEQAYNLHGFHALVRYGSPSHYWVNQVCPLTLEPLSILMLF